MCNIIHRKSIIGAVTLIPLLGLTWLIGVFSVDSNSTVFAWLFVVLTTTQVFTSTDFAYTYCNNYIGNNDIFYQYTKK